MWLGEKLKVCFFVLFIIGIHDSIHAQYGAMQGSSPTPSSTIQTLPPLRPNEPSKVFIETPGGAFEERKPLIERAVPQALDYLHPGVLANVRGKWEGTDNLLNLPANIGIYADIFKSPKDPLPITEEQIQRLVANIFASARIVPIALGSSEQPPLPAFQIKLFLYPIEGGYAAFCEARLFESVIPTRFNLSKGMAFQAITWQRESLFVVSKDQILNEIQKQVENMAKTFVAIFLAYESRKAEVIEFRE